VALSFKVRATFTVMKALSAVGVLPTAERVVRQPMAKRLAMGPGKGMVGVVPDVPSYDTQVPARDGSQIRVRVYAPEGATRPVVYAHGGGFALGGIASCDHICRRLAVEANAVVVSVEYRLAPEHRYPVPLQDCEDVVDWVLTQDWDARGLVVAGDSAGGNLAAGLALKLRDRGTPLAGQLLIYPAVDMTGHAGVRAYRGLGLTTADCLTCTDLYMGDGDRSDPYASPLHAPDLSGLAPALVVIVEEDPLREEGAAYAARLLEAGVPTALLDVPGHVHGSLSVPKLYTGVDEVYARMAAFVSQPELARG
jgi:acetyl esterase